MYFMVRETAPRGLILSIYMRIVLSPQQLSWDIYDAKIILKKYAYKCDRTEETLQRLQKYTFSFQKSIFLNSFDGAQDDNDCFLTPKQFHCMNLKCLNDLLGVWKIIRILQFHTWSAHRCNIETDISLRS